jgi:hypothetical protein
MDTILEPPYVFLRVGLRGPAEQLFEQPPGFQAMPDVVVNDSATLRLYQKIQELRNRYKPVGDFKRLPVRVVKNSKGKAAGSLYMEVGES